MADCLSCLRTIGHKDWERKVGVQGHKGHKVTKRNQLVERQRYTL